MLEYLGSELIRLSQSLAERRGGALGGELSP